jgi:menaquinone-9 beta-reductase
MYSQKIKTTICIIGAGPAGSTASIFLCKMGIAHVIVDAAIFPRDKICGDGIDLNAIRVLNHIDPVIVEKELVLDSSGFTASQGFRFILPGGKKVDVTRKLNGSPLQSKPMFFISKRIDFDNFLVNKINSTVATTYFGTRIEKITKTVNGWLLEGKNTLGVMLIETDFLVGADGDHSVVLKHIGERKIDRNNYAGAVRQYWKGVKGAHPGKLMEVYFPTKLPLSYFWIFPMADDTANVGYGMASNYIAKKNINVRKEFETMIKTDPLLTKRFKHATALETVKGWGLPMSGTNRKASGDGWLLIGDAAALVCPTSGEGIGMGMISGYIAARFLQRAASKNDFSEKMFTHFHREIHKRLKAEEKIYRIFNTIPPRLFSFAINTILGTRLFKYWLSTKTMNGWIDTAYNKEIEVNFN